jgi:hypothetical protein
MKEKIKNLLFNIALLILLVVLTMITPILAALKVLGIGITLIAYVITHMLAPLTDKNYEVKWKILDEIEKH